MNRLSVLQPVIRPPIVIGSGNVCDEDRKNAALLGLNKVDKAKALSSFDPSTENASLQLFELYAFKGNRSFTSRSRGKLAELGVKGLACLLVVNAERSEVLNYALVDIISDNWIFSSSSMSMLAASSPAAIVRSAS